MFGKVAVLMGGRSAERDISLQTGQAVLEALRKLKIKAEGIDAVSGYVQKLIDGKFDRVFIALHGPGGEDGSVQGLLEHLGIPYTGSGVLGSAICLDKQRSKRIWQSMGLATLPFSMIGAGEDPAVIAKSLGLPLAVKPSNEGSSVGVKRVDNYLDLYDACKDAALYGNVMLEKWIDGEEYTIGILNDQVLPPIQIIAGENFYDFQAKYLSNETQYLCPTNLSAKETKSLESLCLTAFKALGASGWGRVDVMRDQNGDFWLLEVNTVPGLTSHSLVPKAAKAIGISFEKLIEKVLAQTLEPSVSTQMKKSGAGTGTSPKI